MSENIIINEEFTFVEPDFINEIATEINLQNSQISVVLELIAE